MFVVIAMFLPCTNIMCSVALSLLHEVTLISTHCFNMCNDADD